MPLVVLLHSTYVQTRSCFHLLNISHLVVSILSLIRWRSLGQSFATLLAFCISVTCYLNVYNVTVSVSLGSCPVGVIRASACRLLHHRSNMLDGFKLTFIPANRLNVSRYKVSRIPPCVWVDPSRIVASAKCRRIEMKRVFR